MRLSYAVYIFCLFGSVWSKNAKKQDVHESSGNLCLSKVRHIHEERIIGGKEAAPKEYPWMAFLILRYVPDTLFFSYDDAMYIACGGSLIRDSWVLTAAHCMSELMAHNGTRYRVDAWAALLGRYNISAEEEGGVVAGGGPNTLYPHPNYNGELPIVDYDIGLMRLNVSVELSDKIQLLSLATEEDVEKIRNDSFNAYASGWGLMSDEFAPDILRKTNFLGIKPEACQEGLPDFGLTDRQMCSLSEVSNYCSGDSGSPLVYEDDNGCAKQIGIVSMAGSEKNGECSPNGISIQTFVPEFKDWIEETIEKVETEIPFLFNFLV